MIAQYNSISPPESRIIMPPCSAHAQVVCVFVAQQRRVFSFYLLCSLMTMSGAFSVTPVCLSACPSVRHTQRRPLSKSNSFDQNFVKLGHIVEYYNIFFNFDNGPYRTVP